MAHFFNSLTFSLISGISGNGCGIDGTLGGLSEGLGSTFNRPVFSNCWYRSSTFMA